LELGGVDMRSHPIEERKHQLGELLWAAKPSLQLVEHLGSGSGRSIGRARINCPDWIKVKNPEAPAVKREAEEEWGRR
jgi:hypothetical protein